jgi:hypothetical protein
LSFSVSWFAGIRDPSRKRFAGVGVKAGGNAFIEKCEALGGGKAALSWPLAIDEL